MFKAILSEELGLTEQGKMSLANCVAKEDLADKIFYAKGLANPNNNLCSLSDPLAYLYKLQLAIVNTIVPLAFPQ